MKKEDNKITSENGKIFRRISDGQISGNEIYLGYTYYINGEVLKEPLLEFPEHYEEIDEPVTFDTIILDEVTELIEETPVEIIEESFDKAVEEDKPQPRKITIGDYMKLEDELQQIKKTLGLI